MARRTLVLTLLAIAAVQLFGPIAFAGDCFELCPDETDGSSCPPVCATCATCPHSRQAIVQTGVGAVAFAQGLHAFPPEALAPASVPAADIFHVPLAG